MPGPPGPCSEGNAWQNYQPVLKDSIKLPVAYSAPRQRWPGHGHFGQHKELEQIAWNGLNIVPVNKAFLVEHPTTKNRSPQECDRIRMEHSIHIVNYDRDDEVPKPMVDMTEAPFPDDVYRVLKDKGFKTPTSIQTQAWPVVLAGHDLVGIAETGSGKTMAYVPPMLVHVLAQPELRPGEGPVGIVLLPSRELCEQVQREVEAFTATDSLSDIRVQALYGGEGFDGQASALIERTDVIVATPGRLIHLLKTQKLNLQRATFVVLDEADELLSGGFEPQIRQVLSQIRPDRQICLFSATWPPDIEELAKDACTFKPIHVNIGSIKLAGCKNIEQTFRLIDTDGSKSEFPGMDKFANLAKSLQDVRRHFDTGAKALVFCNKAETVHEVVKRLKAQGHRCEGFTALSSQSERAETLSRFRADGGPIHFLVCTSLLGRGHDFSRLIFVINYDMPPRMVEYVHRIGRTGRGGEKGFSLTLLELTDLVVARELVDCLGETNQAVPWWLKDACSNKKQKEYRQLRYRKENEARPGEGPDCGRGKARLAEFLREVGGRGAGREVPL